MNTSTSVWILVGAVVVVGGLWYTYMPTTAPSTSVDIVESGMPVPGSNTPEMVVSEDNGTVSEPVKAPTETPIKATIEYNESGFSVAEVIIKKGGTVTWTNTGGGNMWVASAQHPTHTVYAGTSLQEHCPDTGVAFDQCGVGKTFSFTFNKVGNWAYHNHSNASKFGRVIVVE